MMNGKSNIIRYMVALILVWIAVSPTSTIAQTRIHEVKQGETLVSIARAYQMTATELQVLNKLTNERIELGQRLLVRNVESVWPMSTTQATTGVGNDPSRIDAQVRRTRSALIVEQRTSGPVVDFTDFPDFSAIYISSSVPGLKINSEVSEVSRITISDTETLLIVTPTNQRVVFEVAGYGREVLDIPAMRPRQVYWARVIIGETSRASVATDGTIIVDVPNLRTGRVWMDRNLGASRAATSSTDSQAYGDLYQWGRATDGHEKRNSSTTTTSSNSNQPGHGSFILAPNNPYNWRSPQNDNLWQG